MSALAGHAVGKDNLHGATAFGIATDEPLLFEDIELVLDYAGELRPAASPISRIEGA